MALWKFVSLLVVDLLEEEDVPALVDVGAAAAADDDEDVPGAAEVEDERVSVLYLLLCRSAILSQKHVLFCGVAVV
jgi:hypothetical protein